jgi:GH25 family lysozyme M1 (1,4-beta-N-acetylmuramidase)
MAYQLGIDVSKWQENVDWNRVRAADVKFVFMKAVDGTWEDKSFKGHWAGSKAVGLLRGVYHYYRDDQDPKAQAKKLHDVLNSTGDLGELPPALDIEEINNRTLTASKIKLCLEEIERLFGRIPFIYTRATVWNPKIGKVIWASRYPLWVAHYTVKGWEENHIQRTLASQPTLPSPWATWDIWQFTDKSPANNYGISGQTADLDFAEETTLKRLTGKSLPTGTGTGSGTTPPPPTGGGTGTGTTPPPPTGGTTGTGTGTGTIPPPTSTDPWDNKMVPGVTATLSVKVLTGAINLRKTTQVSGGVPSGPTNGSLPQNTVRKVLEAKKIEDRIWARIGPEQWLVVEKRDGTKYAEFVNA